MPKNILNFTNLCIFVFFVAVFSELNGGAHGSGTQCVYHILALSRGKWDKWHTRDLKRLCAIF